MSYTEQAKSDARDMVDRFRVEIIDYLIDRGEASDDLFKDYDDSYHHERHVDKYYDLTEAAEMLDELSGHTETDSGLWQGLEPKEAIGAQAAYTYGNAVLAEWRDLIAEINDDFETEVDDWQLDTLPSEEITELAAKYGIAASNDDDLRDAVIEAERKRIAEQVVSEAVTV